MPTIRYQLIADPDELKGLIVQEDGRVILEFERDVDRNMVDSADEAGETQANMLWEVFEHNFDVHNADGSIVTYGDDSVPLNLQE